MHNWLAFGGIYIKLARLHICTTAKKNFSYSTLPTNFITMQSSLLHTFFIKTTQNTLNFSNFSSVIFLAEPKLV